MIVNPLTTNCRSNTKSGRAAPIGTLLRLDLGIGTIPKSLLTVPAAAGMSLILNVLGVLIIFPLLNLADTLILTSFPLPGFKMYFPKPVLFNLLFPGTLEVMSLSPTPGTDIEIGLSKPL